MSILSVNEIQQVVEVSKKPCLSIFMPTHRAGEQIRQDPIRLKNLIREAEAKLNDAGTDIREMRDLLQPIQKLLDDDFFWKYSSDGLAIFSSPDLFRYYKLPVLFNELVIVGRRFHIKPLLPVLMSDGRFFILALSQNEVRFMEATRYTYNEIVLKDIPGSVKDVLYQGAEKNIQSHSGAPVGRGDKASVFHGQGEGVDDTKANILKYFRCVDAGISRLLAGEQAPLVLAGVDYLLPIYAKANKYPHLLAGAVTGNPEELTNAELRDRAWSVAEPYFAERRTDALERYRQLSGTKHTANELKRVLPASYHGRVELLFVALGVQSWGTFEVNRDTVVCHPEPQADDYDLLDLAAVHTLLNGGLVFALPPEQMPGNENIAAVFRY
jgi:hypothetical protein